MHSRFRMDTCKLSKVMRDLGVVTHEELAGLYSQKVGYVISANSIRNQLQKEGFLTNSLSGHIAALHKIVKLEEMEAE